MIQFSAAGKRFGPKLLFDSVDWMITPRDRIGLVGANGTGKSTLLRLLAGLEQLDHGTLSIAKGLTIGYLPQEGLTLSGRTVLDEAMSVFAPLKQLEQELHSAGEEIARADPASAGYAALAARYQRIEGELRTRDAYSVEARAAAVLHGLGFAKEDWRRATDEFSGGWQMRIALAKLLLEKPDLLLLDEPTNHLDLETRNWLESYLAAYPNAYVLISHDRYFLDVTVTKIVEIWNRRVHFYSGAYEKYLMEKQQRKEQLEAAYKNQRAKIEQLEEFIRRFRAQATKAKQVQSRIKELERIERIELDGNVEEAATIHFAFPQPRASGRTVVEARGLAKSYGEKRVLAGVDLLIERGERIALVGANGAGKSTLIRLLAGADAPTEGELRFGHNVEPDYFAQDQFKALDAERRIYDDLAATAPTMRETELRSLLGCFLFSGDDAFKPFGVLSGGERNRYALAKLLVHPANFLLLDEPTNHLDLRAKDVLLDALRDYNGTVVFVSHDRYFIDKLATRVLEVGGGRVRSYPGNYEDYLWRKQREAESADSGSGGVRSGASAAVAKTSGDVRADDPGAAAKPKRMNPIRFKQIEARAAEVESEIAAAEEIIVTTQTALQSFVSAEETMRLTSLLAQTRERLAALYREWEEANLTLEEQRMLQ
jgi:ATP-binding cassette subfamily F protein 3